MADIFVSYRKGDDEHAKLVELELDKRFEVFQDTSGLRAGDRWGEVLERELEACRVFVPVIGKKWVARGSLKRLAEPEDWVRREILAALARPRVRIAPVLVGGVEKPGELPAELRPLLENQWTRLERGREWVAGVERLRSEIDTWLTGAPPPGGGRVRIPPVLPHLCDRVEPEDAFVERLAAGAAQTRAFTFVLRGHRAERHGGFIDRLAQKHVLEEALGGSAPGVEVWRLEWNADHAREGRFDALLSTAIKRAAMGNRLATDEALRAFVASRPQPQMFLLQVTAEDCRACGDGLLSSLDAAWKGLVGRDEAGRGLVPAHPLVFWINVTCDALEGAPGLAGGESAVLDLRPLEQRHVDDWLELHDVRRWVEGHEPALRAFAADPAQWCAPGKLHMERFEEKVHELLEHA